MATTAELLNASRCIDNCIPEGMKLAVLIYLKQQQIGNTMTPAELMDAARCIDTCIPAGMRTSVLVYLEDAGGGGVEVIFGAATDPNGSVTGDVGDIYKSTTDGTLWLKETGAGTDTGWI